MAVKTIPENAPEHCPGPETEQAGKASACAGCPNQNVCATIPKGSDPDLPLINERLSSVKHKILILSGKGGVGKSTFTAQLAFALASEEDIQVGVTDIDISGPSIPRIMGLEGEQIHQTDSDDAVIWRGPKKNGLIKQFLKDVDWGELDFLLVDTPPGTSDEHLSITQYLKESGIDGAILITTPQEVALQDVRREIDFCRKVKIPVIGVVENMSGFICPNCKGESIIFAPTTGGAKAFAKDFNIPYLGSIPLDPRIGESCDNGVSFLDEFPDSPASKAYLNIITEIKNKLSNEKIGSLK
ncbi:hypothetical protein G9A89_004352 [Geosiphon pyriformis]|nr:hypothetical protein G9A89_004352 [Geosiphon pyriformis]